MSTIYSIGLSICKFALGLLLGWIVADGFIEALAQFPPNSSTNGVMRVTEADLSLSLSNRHMQSFMFDEERQQIVIVYETVQGSTFCYGTIPPQCDDGGAVYRETYGIKDGKLQLIKKEQAEIIPAQPEQLRWPE